MESVKRTLPTLDLKRGYARIKDEINAAVARVIESQNFILGKEVADFEREAASYLGSKYCIGCASGSDALLLALMALDIRPGDEVITTPYTFFATCGSIVRLGAKPVFVDINPGSYNIDETKVLDKVTTRTKVFMPVHLFGQMVRMEGLIEELASRGIPTVEDAAQAFGSSRHFDNTLVRAGAWGKIGCFSFFPTKNLGGYGDGGMVTTNDEALAVRLGRLRVHGAGTTYYHDEVGLNSRLDALQAAVLRVKLKHLEEWNEERRLAVGRYQVFFAQHNLYPFIKMPEEISGNYHIYHQYVIRAQRRDELMQFLQDEGISSRIYYPVPLHLQKCFAFLGGKIGDMPESEKLAAESLALPIFPELTTEEQQWVAETIAKFYKNRS